MKLVRLFLLIVVFLTSLSFVDAFNFNGTVKDINGVPLNNTLINVTIRNTQFQIIGSNSTVSNETGYFSFDVSESNSYFYQPVITYTNGSSYVAFIGQSLPAFPLQEIRTLSNIPFYLKPAGTINITAFNASNNPVAFKYQIKDTTLGYPIAEKWDSSVFQATIYVPASRNYSIMIYPDSSMPISFSLNNITAYTNNTVSKAFNTTIQLVRVTGYINNTGITQWNEFKVIPYLLEPGNMLYTAQAAFPYNMSALLEPNPSKLPQTDFFNLTSGSYNITLVAPAESASYLLFAAGRNGSTFYGGYTNTTYTFGSASRELNITMYGLLGIPNNISLMNAANFGGSKVNASSALQSFTLVNATNVSLSQTSAHVETTVDYTNFGAVQFTFMDDVAQSGAPVFNLPLLNVTGVKEMKIYSQSYAPRRLSLTVSQIQGNSSIALKAFNPGEIDGTLAKNNVNIYLYTSNSTCDLPNPDGSCQIGSSANMNDFNPLSSIMGGGRLSFRMGTGSILVHYVNVDLLASGPPDALFDDSATDSTSGSSFDQALRFGSNGPNIYDYVLVSIPYSESAGSGLNDVNPVYMSIPVLYDDNWNVIWRTSTNGTSSAALAGNQSHYSTYQGDWSILMGSNTCQTNATLLNATNPCYIDTSSNRVWIRLPHFSGTGPTVTGGTLPAASSGGSSSSSSNIVIGKKTTTEEEKNEIDVDYNLGGSTESTVTISKKQGQSVTFSLDGKIAHKVKFKEIKTGAVTLVIESNPIEVTLSIGETKQVDVDGNGVNDLEITLQSIVSETARIIMKKPVEDKPVEKPAVESQETIPTGEDLTGTEKVSEGNKWEIFLWIIAGLIIVGIVVIFVLKTRGRRPTRWHK